MEIYLLVHPALANYEICHGQSDAALNPSWLSQLPQLRKLLPNPVPMVYVSPAPACQVIAPLLAAEGIVCDERLADQNMGDWQGKQWTDIAEADLTAWLEDLENATPHGGESGKALLERVADFFNELLDIGSDALILTHATWVQALLALVLGSDLEHMHRFDLRPLSLSHFYVNNELRIGAINQTP